MFIQTEATRDPASMKFVPGEEVLAEGTMHFRDRASAARSPLATRLFDIEGVSAVLFGTDHITVTAASDADWQEMRPEVLGAIMEHFMSGAPVVAPAPRTAEGGDNAEAMGAQITEALKLVIDPELGYNIVDIGLIYGVSVAGSDVNITMTTTTRGCPATEYLQNGAYEAASSVEGVGNVEVELSYDPPWQPSMMSDEAKIHFGIMD